MTLLLRSMQSIARGVFQPKLKNIGEIVYSNFRVLPIDLDAYGHMNNAKYLNYLEAARWGIQLRSGFLKHAVAKGWTGPLSSIQIEYYRPLKLFQEFEISTQFVKFDEKNYYIVHRLWSEKKETSRALVKGTVRKGRENVAPKEYLGKLGLNAKDAKMPPDISAWIKTKIRASAPGATRAKR